MYSDNFCQSSKKMKDIRQTAKHTFPELYMIGNFYITLMKILQVEPLQCSNHEYSY